MSHWELPAAVAVAQMNVQVGLKSGVTDDVPVRVPRSV